MRGVTYDRRTRDPLRSIPLVFSRHGTFTCPYRGVFVTKGDFLSRSDPWTWENHLRETRSERTHPRQPPWLTSSRSNSVHSPRPFRKRLRDRYLKERPVTEWNPLPLFWLPFCQRHLLFGTFCLRVDHRSSTRDRPTLVTRSNTT